MRWSVRRRTATYRSGQALAEFALLTPLMLLLAVALVDLGRLYSSTIGVEMAAREAADYGAMQGTLRWSAAQTPDNVKDMRARACTAASTLSDYVGDPAGTPNMTCSNPSFSYVMERVPTSGDCSLQTTFEDPCIIHVTMTYDFHMFINFPPLPSVTSMTRESRFAISDLGTP